MTVGYLARIWGPMVGTKNTGEARRMVSAMRLQRVQREVSQIDLFLKTGIPQWRISLIERGIAPKSDEAQRIAEVLGADVKALFPALQEARQ
jgi:hypothetical protein